MSKYDYEKFGRRSYESYVEVFSGDTPPTKEEYETKMDASIDHSIKVRKARYMISALQDALQNALGGTGDFDVLMEVYDVVAPIVNLKASEEVTEEWALECKKRHLKSLIEERRILKKKFEEDRKLVTKVEIITLTEKIKELREDLKGE